MPARTATTARGGAIRSLMVKYAKINHENKFIGSFFTYSIAVRV
jgi:hypothetical protein